MPYRALVSVLAAAAALLGASPALAAPVLRELDPCYVSVDETLRERMTVMGEAFTPGATIDILVDGELAATVTADIDGAFLPPEDVFAPFHAKGTRAFAVRAVERDNPESFAELSTRVAALAMRLRPEPRRPRRKVTWKGLGFTAGKRVFAHYVHEGEHVRTVRLGRARGACGKVRTKRRQFPFKPKTGEWVIRVDNQRRYTAEPRGVYYARELTVSRAG